MIAIVDIFWTDTGEEIKTYDQLIELLAVYLDEVIERAKTEAEDKVIDDINKYFILTEKTEKGRKKGSYKRTENDRQIIRQLYNDGVSKARIADMYEISVDTVRKYLKLQ